MALRLPPFLQSVAGGSELSFGVLLRIGLFLFLFVGIKVVSLVALLWLANVIDPASFGAVELALAAGVIVSAVGLLGLPGGATKLALTMDQPEVEDLLSFATLCIAVPATALAIWGLVAHWRAADVLVLSACAPAAFQTTASVWARIRRMPLLSSVTDPFTMLSMLGLAGGFWLAGRLNLENLALGSTIVSTLVTIFVAAVFIWRRRTDFWKVYVAAVKLSLPILALGGVALVVSTALRPLLAVRFSLVDLALYAVCFRLCAPAQLGLQVVATAFFARLYTASDRGFDLALSGLIAVCACATLFIGAILPWILPYVAPAYMPSMEVMHRLFPAVGLQVILWIGSSFLEMKMGRHDAAAPAAVSGYGLFGLFLAAFLLTPALGLTGATLMFCVFLTAFIGAQMIFLRRRGVHLPLMCWSLAGAGVAHLALLYVITSSG